MSAIECGPVVCPACGRDGEIDRIEGDSDSTVTSVVVRHVVLRPSAHVLDQGEVVIPTLVEDPELCELRGAQIDALCVA